jgi:hypothetical protein
MLEFINIRHSEKQFTTCLQKLPTAVELTETKLSYADAQSAVTGLVLYDLVAGARAA